MNIELILQFLVLIGALFMGARALRRTGVPTRSSPTAHSNCPATETCLHLTFILSESALANVRMNG
jgi:hypothetical protein